MFRQQAAAALVSTTVLVGAASVALPDGRTLPAAEVSILTAAAAQAPCPVEWRDLLGIRTVESGSATLRDDGRVLYDDDSPVRGDGGDSYGPFQFNRPAGTWAAYGNGGDPDRLDDSAAATARKLCASNYATDRRDAIRAHNGSGPMAEAYADKVLALADALPTASPTGPATPGARTSGAPASLHDGITLRVTDAILGQALDGWETLNGRAQDRKAQAPDLARFFELADAYQARYTAAPAGQPNTAKPTPSLGAVASSGQMTCPVGGPVNFAPDFGDPRSGGRRHGGNDLFAEHGTPVVSPVDGLVVDVASSEASAGLGGLAVWVRAEGGPMTGTEFYMAHNRSNVATPGQRVRAGQVIAYVGVTGNASADAPHVHLQIHPAGGAPVDPYPYTSAACATNRKGT